MFIISGNCIIINNIITIMISSISISIITYLRPRGPAPGASRRVAASWPRGGGASWYNII